MSPAAVTITLPLTRLLLASFNKKVVEVMVAPSILLLNVAVNARFAGTPVAPFTGLVEITVGGISTVSVRLAPAPTLLATINVKVVAVLRTGVAIGTPLVTEPSPSIRPVPWNTAVSTVLSPGRIRALSAVKLSTTGGA